VRKLTRRIGFETVSDTRPLIMKATPEKPFRPVLDGIVSTVTEADL
jgi:hypothetical protein